MMKNARAVSGLSIIILFIITMNVASAGDLDGGDWASNSSVVNGLPSVNNPTPTAFDDLGARKLISGNSVGTFIGWDWNGTGWASNSSIVSGLVDAGTFSAPAVFNDSGTLKLITGERYGAFIGYQWSGSTWVSNSTLISGLDDVGDRSTLTVFNDGGTWKLITGNYVGTFSGYYWSGSAWISDPSVVSGLGDIGYNSAPTVFNDSGTLILIAGEQHFIFNGYYWSGSTWISNPGLVSGLPTSGQNNLVPTVYSDSGTWKLIAGDDGTNTLIGFQWIPRPPNPVSLNSASSNTFVNWTWSAGSGGLNTDSYNVSVNSSWTNGSANTYYNHYLGETGGISTITVWAYNLSNDILSAGNVTESKSTLYTPPNPINLANSTSGLNVNFTFEAGSGNVTDSFNISTNNGTVVVWNNGSSNIFSNTSTDAHGHLEIVVYAYNSSGSGTLSTGYITDNVTIPNNNVTITNTSDWYSYRSATVYVDYDSIDADNDTSIFSCSRTDLFTDFDTSTGQGSWITTMDDTGLYFVSFGVSDDHGSTDNYIMTITVLDAPEWENLVLDQTGVIHYSPEYFYNSPYKFTDGDDSTYAIVGTTAVCGADYLYMLWDLGEDKQIEYIRWKVAVGTEDWPTAYVRLLTSSESPVSYTEIDYHEGSDPYNLSDTSINFSEDDRVRYIKVDINRDNCFGFDSGILGYELEVWGHDVFYAPPTPTPTPTRSPVSTPIVAVLSTVLSTPEMPEIPIPEEELTIFEEILLFVSTAFSWLFILAAYVGAFASSSILVKESENFEETKYDILLFGTIGWIIPLFINFTGLITLVTESFWLNAIIFAAFGFAIYAIGNAFSKD